MINLILKRSLLINLKKKRQKKSKKMRKYYKAKIINENRIRTKKKTQKRQTSY